jgi:MFS family permease
MTTESSPDHRFTRPVAVVLFVSVCIMVVGQSCLFTILPPLGRQIGLSEVQIGLVMSIHGIFMLIAGPWWGDASETMGRRRVILIGAALYTISFLMFGLVIEAALSAAITSSMAMWLLIGTRSLFAVGAGAVTPASMALAADLSSRDTRLRAMSLLAAAVSTGAILGPGASALFAGFGLAAPFYAVTACGLLVMVAARFVLPPVRMVTRSVAPSFRNLLRGRVLVIAIASWLFMCGNYGIFSIFGFYVQDQFSLDAVTAARTMGFGLMGASGASVFMQAFVIRRLKAPTHILVWLGVPIVMASFVWVGLAPSPWHFVAALTLNGLGQSFVNPAMTTALSLSVGPEGQGRLAGLSTSMQALAFLVGPVSSATMYAAWPLLPFGVGVLMTLISLCLIVALRRAGGLPSQSGA